MFALWYESQIIRKLKIVFFLEIYCSQETLTLITNLIFFNLIGCRWVYPAAYTKSVKGDIVLITGGGSGIGRLMSLKLADLGAIIVTWDVNTKGNEETVR